MNAAAEALYAELNAAGIETALDDRGLRPGAMFADIEADRHPAPRGGVRARAGSGHVRIPRAQRRRIEQLDRAALLARLGAN